MFTQEEIRSAFYYDPETGSIFNRDTGDEYLFDNLEKSKYLQIKYNSKWYILHRLIWMYMYGTIPDNLVIDHKNGDGKDNRISNLRLANNFQNAQNTKKHYNSKSGIKGVTWNKASQK